MEQRPWPRAPFPSREPNRTVVIKKGRARMPRVDPYDEDRPGLMPIWRKSSRSLAGGDCVEVARLAADRVGFRDSKAAAGAPVLSLRPAEARRLVRRIRTDHRTLPPDSE